MIVISDLIKNYPDAELCMVGPNKDGTMKNCILLCERLNILNNVKFMGLLSKDEWIKLSYEYDIFINTTNYDNMPVSIIEAMALGFPIVSTNVGGLRYLHEDGTDALLVEKNDISQMVKYITRIIDNSKIAKELSINARKKAEDFDWYQVKSHWVNLLNTIS